MSESTADSYEAPRKSNKNAIIIAILCVVIVVQGVVLMRVMSEIFLSRDFSVNEPAPKSVT